MGNRRMGVRRLEAVLDNLLDHTVLNGLNGSPFIIKNPDRYYVEEYFEYGIPQLNAVVLSSADGNNAAQSIASRTVELIGNAAASADITRSATGAGITLTGDNDGDTINVTGHLDASLSAMGMTAWGSETELQFETLVRTDADIDELTIGAGWKLAANIANVASWNFATDDNSCHFAYGASDDDTGTLADNTALYFFSNHGAGNDVRVKLPIVVAANTSYRLGITIDSSRRVSAWVDGVQYGLAETTTAGEYKSGGANNTTKSAALTNDINFVPAVGIVIEAGNSRLIHCAYIKCSRVAYDNS